MSKNDSLLYFCDATTITATETNALIGDVVPLGTTPTLKDIGVGGPPLYWVIDIQTAVTSNSAVTVQFSLLSDSTADLATSATTHITTPAIAKATLVAGYRLIYPLPPGEYEAYLGIFAATSGGTLLTGTCDSYITSDFTKVRHYPDAL
jgi:hypothetical protein